MMSPQPHNLRRLPSPITAGVQLRDYEVLATLGEGGMGKVYRVRHRILGTEHALKVPSFESAELRARFLREARVTAGLRHRCINRATDLFEWEGRLLMVSDLVVGQSIGEWAKTTLPSPARVGRVFLDILDGLEHAHAARVLHRDLTPSNVLIQAADDAPCLLDFGACDDLDAGHGLTKTGFVLGNRPFLAPEILLGERSSVASDIYQVALLMRICLDPTSPVFPSGSEERLVRAIAAGRATPLPEHIPHGLRRVVEIGMSLNPYERFSSCREMARAIREALSVRPPAELSRAPVNSVTRWLVPIDPGTTNEPLPDVHPIPAALRDTRNMLVFGSAVALGGMLAGWLL